jgi:ribonuclease P/MRP protein subunit POP5
MKLSFLPPTLRKKQRYIVFEIISKKSFNLMDITNSIWNQSLILLGEAGAADASLWVPNDLYDKERGRGVIKCNHTSVEKVRAVLASIKHIEEEPVIMHVLGVTGTIKGAKRKFLGLTDLSDFRT